MMEKGRRPPSRPVKLNFDHLVRQSQARGIITAAQVAEFLDEESPTESDLIPTESELSTVREEPPVITGGRAKLKAARIAKGLSVKDLCKAVGYSQLIYRGIEDGNSNMSRKQAEKVAELLGIPVEDLLDGSDHPPANGTHHGTVGETPNIDLPPGSKARFVPLLSMAQCGQMMAYDDTAYDHNGFLAMDCTDGKAFAVTLAGDSMIPEFRPGDKAVIYPSATPRNGCVVIARLNEENGGDVMLKLYQQAGDTVTLSSYNPAYPPMQFPRNAFAWIYKVQSVTRIL